MREITFRGIQTHGLKAGRWVYGSLILSDDEEDISEGYGAQILSNTEGRLIYVRRETVGQLIDTEALRLFEGDIVALFGASPDLTPAAIEFTNNAWELSTTSSRIDAWAMEVIGKIYENPEMLEKSE